MKLSISHSIRIRLGGAVCVLLLTACDSPTQVVGSDPVVQFAKGGKGGRGGGGGGNPPPVESNYTVKDLGPGVGGDISDGGIVVGALDNEATLWKLNGTPVPLGNFGGSQSWAGAINRIGTRAVGETWSEALIQQAAIWELAGGSVLAARVLQPLNVGDQGHANGVNNVGQAVGQSRTSDGSPTTRRAVLWEANGTPVELPTLPEGRGGWAIGINNSGHIVGKSFFDFPARFRAVLWIVDGQDITAIDLTSDSDESGDNQATHVGEIENGMIEITGFSSLGGERMGTIWTVNAETGERVAVLRPIPVGGTPSALNSEGEVLVTNPARVWDRNAGTAEALPTLSDNCLTQARSLNDAGTVVGKSQIKVKGRCTDHTVIWTKNDP